MSWRRILLLSIALVAALAVVTWAMLQNSDLATDFVRRELHKVFAVDTSIATTSVQLQAGRLSLTELTIQDPTAQERTLLRVPSAHIDAQLRPFAGGVQIRHVVVDEPEIECGPDWPTAEQLFASLPQSADSAAAQAFPVIEVRRGKATVHACADQPPIAVERFDLTVVPLADRPHRLQLRGSLQFAQPAATVTVGGEFDLDDGSARLLLSTSDVACDERVVDWLLGLAHLSPQTCDIGGEIASLQVACTLPPRRAADRTPRFEVAASCRNVRMTGEGLPRVVRNADVKLFVDTDGEGTLQATVAQRSDDGELTVTALATALTRDGGPDLELRAGGRGIVIDDEVLHALRTFPIGARIVRALQPTAGRADLDLYLKNPHVPGGETELDLHLRDVAMAFHGFGDDDRRRIGFPLPLEHAKGHVFLRDRVLLIEDTEATIAERAGGGSVKLTGRIDLARDPEEHTRLDINGAGLAFSPDLRRALARLLHDDGALYDRLAPSGRADVDVQVRPRSELRGGFAVQVRPQGAAMRWQGFPYRLGELHGTIAVGVDEARFDLRGRHGDGGLTMRGHIPLNPQHRQEDGFEAVIDLDQLAVDEDLRRATAAIVPELDPHWRRARPTGRLSGRVKVWRPRFDGPLFHDVRLQFEGVDLQLPVAPWRATGLRGQVLVQGAGAKARIDFDALRGVLEDGRGPPAQLALLGHIESAPEVARDLAFVVRDLELTDQLGDTLDELGALGYATWQSLRPSGRVDLVVRERIGPSRPQDLRVVVQLVDVRSEAPMLPRPAEHMTGELHIADGVLTFRDVRGKMEHAVVHCTDGRVETIAAEKRTRIAFHVHSKDFPVDDGLANLFSGPLRDAVLARELRGRADVDGLRLEFSLPNDDREQPFTTTIRGGIGLDGVDVKLGSGRDGIRLDNLHGTVTLAESVVGSDGGQLVGTLTRGALSLFGHPFESLDATFTADAERLQLSTLAARIHAGELRNAQDQVPALTYLLPCAAAPDGRLSADIQFSDVDVFSLLTASGWRNPPYTGRAAGRIRLQRLDGNDVVSALGSGSLRITRGDLGQVPLFAAIYAQLPPADQPRFKQLDVDFRLTDHQLVFDKLDVRSDILAAKGTGRLELDGYLDVKMELDNLLGTSADPVLMPFLQALTQSLVSFRLHGYLRDLRADTELAGSGTPRRRAIVPMPPHRARPKTPGY